MQIAEARVSFVTYGLQRPACHESSTTCWEDNLRMQWSIRLLSPVESHQGCLIRFRLAAPAPSTQDSLLATNQAYLRRIQQGEPSSVKIPSQLLTR